MEMRRIMLILIMIGTAIGCSFMQVASDIELELTATAWRLTDAASAPSYTETAAVMAVTYAHYYQENTRLAVEIPATQTALVPSRTAIALTRQPELSTPATLHPLELTATALVTPIPPTLRPDEDPWAATASKVVAEITQTEASIATAIAINPALALTATALAPRKVVICAAYIPYQVWSSDVNNPHEELESQVSDALSSSGIEGFIYIEPVVQFYGFAITGYRACSSVEVIETSILIAYHSDLDDIDALTGHVEKILAILSEQFPQLAKLALRTRLTIDFRQFHYENPGNPASRSVTTWLSIDTDYQNALDAYDEGLRGEKLVEAVGGWIPYYSGW
jgi:hypothetical protein